MIGDKSRNTSIHTRISDTVRISSIWRRFANENFETDAWETFLWVDNRVTENYDTLTNAERVVELHDEIVEKWMGDNS